MSLKARFAAGTLYRRRRLLLALGMGAPVFAFLSVVVAVAAYPNFNHATQFLSELGGPQARLPMLFNGGVMVSGAACGLAGVGFGLAVVALGGSRIAAGLLTLCFLLAGVGMVISSIYIWPDPRHLWINLGLGIILAPIFLLWGLGRTPKMAWLRWFLLGVCVVMALLALITNHRILAGAVNPANVGWWERLFAIVLVGWTGIAAYGLERRLWLDAQAPRP